MKLEVKRLERDENGLKSSKFFKPRNRRDIKKDALIQMRILSLESGGS